MQVELIERVRTALVMIVSQSVPGVFGIAPCTCVAKRVDETSAKTERGGKRHFSQLHMLLVLVLALTIFGTATAQSMLYRYEYVRGVLLS